MHIKKKIQKEKKHTKFSKFWKWFKRVVLSLILIILVCIAYLLYSFWSLRSFAFDSFSLAGFPFNHKAYIVVAQNDAELRPTGGFISAFALVEFRSGKPHIEMHDVYGFIDDHDFVEPPYPFGDLLSHPNYKGHSFRDANVYADFSKSAEELIKFYHINYPDTEIDGVVAINFSLFEDILDITGEIDASGDKLNSNNLFEELEHEVNNIDLHNIEDIATRKQFLQPIFNETIKSVLKQPLLWKSIGNTIAAALDNKDIQLYFSDPKLQEKYTKLGWTGDWPKTSLVSPGDFLGVVETNLGGMKSNRYITRDVKYDVYLEETSIANTWKAKSKVSIEIEHNGTDNIPVSGDYSSFLRVYTPLGSTLAETPGTALQEDIISYEELDHTVFAKTMELKPGESTTFEFTYDLPANVVDNPLDSINLPYDYSLQIFRQSATNDFYDVTIHAPRGIRLVSDDLETREHLAFFRNILNSNQQFNINIEPDHLSPLVIFQKMTSLTRATIHFNEDIILTDTELPYFEFIDTNFINKETDTILVKDVSIDPENPRVVNLELEGVLEAPEERYKVRIRGITDIYGNRISPEPTEITIIQRF